MRIKNHIYWSLFIVFLTNCKPSSSEQTQVVENSEPQLFSLLSPEQTHVDFQNVINEGLNTNVLMYEYFYNGGGVAVGDLNNDGFEDLYFTANLSPNKLYLNKGKKSGEALQFEDITTISRAAGREGPWKTGVVMADVNGDGKLDIYICHSGNLPSEKKANELFINEGNDANGIPKFTDRAAEYGLDSQASSTNAYFFDYDRDGDLDLLLLNHNIKSLPVLNEASSAEMIKADDPISGTRFFRNDAGHFIDITKKAGINGSPLSYGLGAGVADINQDGWPDIYISNDYTIPDRLYINNKKGGFIDQLKASVEYTSQFSMGNDVADVNNDAAPDIFTLDMLPEDNRRQKLLMAPDNYEKFDMVVRSGFHKQYMRNMLHINTQTSTSEGVGTSEIGQLAGISNTDWSWSALFADYDNDGWKDLYITNGYFRDYTNLDFLKYQSDFMQTNQGRITRESVLSLVQQMPSSNVVNYLYKNNKDLTFKNVGSQWGLGQNSNSNGAVYADLDNDGDLDLVVNNINQAAFIYQNNAEKLLKNNYLRVKLDGNAPNTAGIGAKITLYNKNQHHFVEQMPMRGYQSSVSNILHFGLADAATIDSVRVVWPTGKQQILKNVKANQVLVLSQKNAIQNYKYGVENQPVFKEVQSSITANFLENTVNDFKRQPLMVNAQSYAGPCMTKADVNADGLEDIYVGGGDGQAGQLFLQQKDGRFLLSKNADFEKDKTCYDTDAAFFDADADGDLDLYVCSGGYGNLEPNDVALQDRIYINDGKGSFTKDFQALPNMPTSSGTVSVADVNSDGRPDLFVGGRVVPGMYPESPKSYILINKTVDKKVRFEIGLGENLGMVTDSEWADLDGDKKPELLLTFEWMPIKVLKFSNNQFSDVTNDYFEKPLSGWWNKIWVGDLNGDKILDIVAGNQGLNTQCKVSESQPAELYAKDFDDNGRIDPIFCNYVQGKSYPYVTRDELVGQMGIMGKRYPDYKSYADATLTDIFTKSELDGATKLEVNCLKTTLLLGTTNHKFKEQPLPIEVQLSPVFAIQALDIEQDGDIDLLLCGNTSHARLRLGQSNANRGVLLRNNGKAQFEYLPQQQSGLMIKGDVRSIVQIKDKLYFGINQKGIKAYSLK